MAGLLALSDAHLELGELDAAEAALQQVLDLKPAAPAYLRAGYLLHLRGEGGQALGAFNLALDAIPPSERRLRAWAEAEAGHVLRHQGQWIRADRRYARALELDPRCGEALRGRGMVAWSLGALEQAEDFLRRAPATPAGLGELARLQAERGHDDDAERTLLRALALGASDPHWNRSLARCLADWELEPARAVALAEAELAIRPGPQTRDTYAWALHRAGRHAEALAEIERALACGVREPAILAHAGAIARAVGDERAIGWLSQAHELDPQLAR